MLKILPNYELNLTPTIIKQRKNDYNSSLLIIQIMKPVIVLDLNGVLIQKNYKDEIPNINSILQYDYYSMNKDVIVVRKDLSLFLSKLFNKYSIVIYSSTTRVKVEKILSTIMTPQQKMELLAIWCRENTLQDPEENNYKTIKSLEAICLTFGIDLNSIIIIDDELSKIRFIRPKNSLVIDTDSLTNKGYFNWLERKIDQKMTQLTKNDSKK